MMMRYCWQIASSRPYERKRSAPACPATVARCTVESHGTPLSKPPAKRPAISSSWERTAGAASLTFYWAVRRRASCFIARFPCSFARDCADAARQQGLLTRVNSRQRRRPTKSIRHFRHTYSCEAAMSTPFGQTSIPANAFAYFPEAIAGDQWIEPLRDGTAVLIRPLQETDRERELAFISNLSHKARRFRFLGDFKQVSKTQIDQLMNIDYEHRMALVALVHDYGTLKEIGISRYSATTDEKKCECAVTVADEWQHKGLGVLLMRHLINYARRKGFK